MPRASHIKSILERRKTPRLGSREWRRFPARKGVTGRDTVDSRKPAVFDIGLSVTDGVASFTINNRTGHTERIVVLGTDPVVSIEVDGNTRHSASLPVTPGSATVEIRHNDRGGKVLANANITQGELENANSHN